MTWIKTKRLDWTEWNSGDWTVMGRFTSKANLGKPVEYDLLNNRHWTAWGPYASELTAMAAAERHQRMLDAASGVGA